MEITFESEFGKAVVQATKEKKTSNEPFLTESQEKATKTLQDFYWGKRCGGKGRISGRFQPLLVGTSGSGKSHIARQTARTLGVPFYHINLGDWIVRGAIAKPYAIESIRDFVLCHQTGIIFIDEVDKLRSTFVSTQGWWQSISTELFALLDGSSVLESLGWNKKAIVGLEQHLIVGGGAWHDVLTENVRTAGFGEQKPPSLRERVEKSGQIPYEVLARFSPALIEITPPTREDFIRGFSVIFEDAGRSFPRQKLEELADHALKQGRGVRSLEHFATQMAIRAARKVNKTGFLPAMNSGSWESTSQRAEKFKKILKAFEKQTDRVAESAIQLAAVICRHKEYNTGLRYEPETTLSDGLGFTTIPSHLGLGAKE